MDIKVINQQPQIAVAIKRTAVSMDSLHQVIDEVCTKLLKHLAQLGKEMSGAPYLAYMNANDDFSKFDIEWGFPVDEPIPVSGEITMSRTYEGKAITATHKGPYGEIEKTYNALMEYAKENSLESTGVFYDYYLNNPNATPESELLTQVVFAIR